MSSIANISKVREVGGFPTLIEDRFLEAPLRRASRILKSWISAGVYDATLAEVIEGSERKEALREAEALLAVMEALPIVNRIAGGLSKVRTVSSAGGNITDSFWTADEITAEQKRLELAAKKQAEAYIPVASMPVMKSVEITGDIDA